MRMRCENRIIGMVPAKLASTRLPMKNLALLGGRPLIYYAVKAARDAGVFDEIIINAEDAIFEKIARRYGTGFYKRPGALVRKNTKTDEVIYDFLKKHPCRALAWISPIAPLQTGAEVRGAVKYFLKKKLDSLITVRDEQVHCLYSGRPVNFKFGEIFARTQDLRPVNPFVYSVMMWRPQAFMKSFEKNGYGLLSGKAGFYPVSRLSSVIIKNKTDLMLADCIMRSAKGKGGYKVKYDGIAPRRVGRRTGEQR